MFPELGFFWKLFITIVILQGSVFVTTIYLHRAMCHRGLELNPWVANAMHLYLSLFTGIVPREWVAVHRKHHHFSDKKGDPHSPYLQGMWNVLFNNFFMYRKEIKNLATVHKYTPDYKPDMIDRIPGNTYGAFGGLVLFVLMFGLVWGATAWIFHVVVYIFLNSGVNSLCHWLIPGFSYRNFSDNLATNFPLWAWLTGGEGLHNNHHEYPSSAKFAVRKREIDPAWTIICFLVWTKVAKVDDRSLAEDLD